MDWDLMEWMTELQRSHAVENAAADNVPNKVCSTDGKVGQGLVEEHQIVKSTDGSQELKEAGEETTGKVGQGLVEEHQIVKSTDGSQELKEAGEETTGKVGRGLVEELQVEKVMTDEQEEELRRQVSVFHAIRESLLESYKRIASEYLSQHGTRIENPSTDPLKTTEGYKGSNRKQRWSATPMQRLILDKIYHSGKVSPNKEEIKWITSELSQHGEITESNVYNWFQNRKTREKRKRVDELVHKIKSEVEPGAESSNGKKIRLEKIDFDNKQYLSTDAHFFQTSEVNYEMHSINQEFDIAQDMNPSIDNLSSYDPSQIPVIEKTQANPSSNDAHFLQTSQVNSEMHSINQEFDIAQDTNPSIDNLSSYDPSQIPVIEKTQANPSSNDAHFFQTSEVNSEMHFINQEFDIAQDMNPSIDNLSSYDPSQIPAIEKTQANPSNDYLMEDLQILAELDSFDQLMSDLHPELWF